MAESRRRSYCFEWAEGLRVVENHLWVDVKGMKGPLVETAAEKTKQFTRDILLSLKKN